MTTRDDETMPVLNTKVSRREYDRFALIAVRLRKTPYALLQDIIYGFNEWFLADDAGLGELYAVRRKLEAGIQDRFEQLFTEQGKRPAASPMAVKSPTEVESGEDDVARVLKRFVATVNAAGIPAAIAESRDLDDDVRVRLQTRLAKDLPDLWHQVRPYISGKLKVNPEGKPGVYPPPHGEGEL